MAIEWILTDINTIAVAACISQNLRPGIARGHFEVALALCCVELQSIVIGVRIRESIQDLSEPFKRTQRIRIDVCTAVSRKVRSQCRKRNLVEIRLADQMPPQIAYVVSLDKETSR